MRITIEIEDTGEDFRPIIGEAMLERHEIELEIIPQVRSFRGRIVGYEANVKQGGGNGARV